MSLSRKILFVYILLIGSFCFAGETVFLSLEDAIKIATGNSIELKIAKDQVESGKKRIYQSKSQLLPRLSLELESEYEKKEVIEDYWVDFLKEKIKVSASPSPPWENTLLISLNQRLYSGGEITGKINQAKIQKEYLEYKKELTEEDLIFLVTNVYWSVKKSILQTETVSKKIVYLKKIMEMAKKRLKFGEISENELKEVETNLVYAEDDFVQSKTEEQYFKEKLLDLLNMVDDSKIILVDEPKIEPIEIDISFAIDRALVNNSRLKQQKAIIEAKKVDLLLAKSTKYPQINLAGSLNYFDSGDTYGESWNNIRKEDWKIGINVAWPFYNGNLTQKKIEEEEINIMIAKNRYEVIKREIIQEIKEVFQRLQKVESKHKVLEKTLSLAKENLRLAQIQYKMGNITEDEIEKYRVELGEAENSLVKIRIEYEMALAELGKYVGLKKQ